MAWAQTPLFALRRLAQRGLTAAGSAKSRAGAGITKQLSRFANFIGCLATRPGGGGSQKKRSKRSTAKSSSGSDA